MVERELGRPHIVHGVGGHLSTVDPVLIHDHPALDYWARLIERLRWAALLLDPDLCLVWTSPEVQSFLGSPAQDELGYGLPISEALAGDAWRRIAPPGTRDRFLDDLASVVAGDRVEEGVLPPAVATSIPYIEPGADKGLPVYNVDLLAIDLRGRMGQRTGVLVMGYMSVRPGLMSLLARGDEAMYERMARLIEPASREGAILFCDLEGSTELSRTLPTAEYFHLIRNLWTEIDAVVASYSGIVGKHAGDGASAFFLADDLGSASAAAAAATRAAREIHERSERIFGTFLERPCSMRIGLHWGGSLYIGQLVPGGRLDVTALGDAVNECARIQDCAEPQQTLASKDLIEMLTRDEAAAFGVDQDKARYRLLTDLSQGSSEKTIRTVGAIPVTAVS